MIFWLMSAVSVLIGVTGALTHTLFSTNSVILLLLVAGSCWALGLFEENRNRARSGESRNVDDFSFSNPYFRPLVFSVSGVVGYFLVLD
jgi:hypothetical protein